MDWNIRVVGGIPLCYRVRLAQKECVIVTSKFYKCTLVHQCDTKSAIKKSLMVSKTILVNQVVLQPKDNIST
ncbi:hypothetical protein AG1IA_08718 [Rhizoctonia solani AG-1 IA]|uniref:Uncharacterized protein n=1 Tax=Thanatephorus cucumeris (strain AG1-IA) TaxID=983506 RepID=L8WKB8_THACA|nr:hypothetical protein AG1IA_08718 [Rhizoctonia solani AG-1 IA]